MERNYFDQTDVEQILGDIVKSAGISKNVFVGSRPRSVAESMDDFVVVKLYGKISDLYTFGRTTCSVHLFARDVQFQKNGKKLSIMQRGLVDALVYSKGRLHFGDIDVVADAYDDVGFHARIINIPTIIKVK